MSILNSLFNRGLLGAKCKTFLNLAISRIKHLRNKRELQLKQMGKEIAQFLQTGQEAIARIRVEHIVREMNILAAYEILELFCEFVLARVPILETQRECPPEMQEAIASIIFAAPRCSDLPELMQIRNLFMTKYGKEFVSAASELRPDSSVNRVIIEKLSPKVPSADVKLRLMRDIAQECGLDWDSSITEAEFSKKHEDLLDGSKKIQTGATDSEASIKVSSVDITPSKEGQPFRHTDQNQVITQAQAPLKAKTISFSCNTLGGLNKREQSDSSKDHNADQKMDRNMQTCDVMERARAAIATAEKASAAARAAAKLANSHSTRFGRWPANGKAYDVRADECPPSLTNDRS